MYKRTTYVLMIMFFLFGSRGTGKSTLLKKLAPKEYAKRVDLLDPKTEDRLARNPGYLKDLVQATHANELKIFVVDDIQKIPELLDVVHGLIENENALFAMTALKCSEVNTLRVKKLPTYFQTFET